MTLEENIRRMFKSQPELIEGCIQFHGNTELGAALSIFGGYQSRKAVEDAIAQVLCEDGHTKERAT